MRLKRWVAAPSFWRSIGENKGFTENPTMISKMDVEASFKAISLSSNEK